MGWFEHDGYRIYFEDVGDGSPLLFLPGWTESIDEFLPLRRALEPRYRVVAADLPGSGKSGPQPRTYTPAYYHDDALVFVALIGHLGIAPAHVVGFSDGGEVALLMAILAPHAVRSVVAWGAAGELVTPADELDALEDVVDAPVPGQEAYSEHLKRVYGEANARHMTRSTVAAWRAIVAAGGDISRSQAHAIACPVLLITGEDDVYAPPEVVRGLASVIPRGEFAVVSGGHWLHLDQEEWLARTIVGWLAGQGPARPFSQGAARE
jgi:valacyclovir hydrolase